MLDERLLSKFPFTALPFDQTPNLAAERLGWHQRRVARRIGNRAIKAIERGDDFGVPVRGGILGLLRTKHDPDIYAAVDGYLEPRGLELKVHRDDKSRPGSHNMRFLDIDDPIHLSDNQIYPEVFISD